MDAKFEKFYSNLSSSFEEHLEKKNHKPNRIKRIIRNVLDYIFILIVIPVIPYLLDRYLEGLVVNYFSTESSFWSWFIFSIIGYGVLKIFFAILLILSDIFSKENKKNDITFPSKFLPFCFLYKAIKLLEENLITGSLKKYQEAIVFFDNYLSESELNAPVTFLDSVLVYELEESYFKKLEHVMNRFDENYPWFDLDDLSKKMVENYSSILKKIYPVISQADSHEKIKPALVAFLQYELNKINFGNDYKGGKEIVKDIENINTELLKLPIIQLREAFSIKETASSIQQEVSLKLNSWISNESIFVRFFTSVSLLLLFAIFLYLIISFIAPDLDNKIVATLIAVPIAGALSMMNRK